MKVSMSSIVGKKETIEMTTSRRKRHTPEQIVRKLRDADAMLNAGKDLAAVLQALEVGRPLSVRAEVNRRYNDELQAALANTPWAGSCTSWYKTADGRILNNWPHTAKAYADAVARFEPADFEVVGARAPEPAE